MFHRKKLFLLFFLTVTQLIFCQNKTQEQIQKLLKQSDNYANIDDEKSLKYALQAYGLASKKGTSYDKAITAKEVAYSYFHLDMFKESIPFIKKGLREKATEENVNLFVNFKDLESYNYGYIGLYDQELEILNDIEKLIVNRNDEESISQLAYNYLRISDFYFNLKNFKKTEQNINKALKIINHNNVQDYTRSCILNSKGYLCLELKKMDSAFYYFNKDYQETLAKQKESKYIQLTALGDFFQKKSNHEKALPYYFAALKNIEIQKISDLEYNLTIHKNISEAYHSMGDNENEQIHLKKHLEFQQQFKNKNNENAQAIFNELTNDFDNKKTDLGYIILIISVFSIIIFSASIHRIRQFKKKKNKLIWEKEKILSNKDLIITEKENIAKLLEQKLEFSLDDITEAAKKNDLSFFVKFQQFYPEFTPTILNTNPNLISTELHLLAYIYLDFSSKEIADYTFKSIRTIQSRKYHLRKKLNIDTQEDFHTWLRKIF